MIKSQPKAERYDPRLLKGQLTVFLSLILMLVIAFLLALYESAGIRLAKGESRAMSSMALDSVFGEYHKELLEQYDVFFLDGSYLGSGMSEAKIMDRFRDYVSYETDMERGTGASGHAVNWGCTLESSQITAMELATDDSGAAFREQACMYIKEQSGLGLLQELTGTDDKLRDAAGILKNGRQVSYDTLSEGTSYGMEIAGQIASNAEIDAQTQAELAAENPLEEVTHQRSRGILAQVLEDPQSVSNLKMDTKEAVSRRALKQGYGAHIWDKDTHQLAEDVLFRQYMKDRLSCYTDDSGDDAGLSYGLEYVIAGKESDRENMKTVLERLLYIRIAQNLILLETDTAKREETEALAVSICTVGLVPEASGILAAAIRMAWAYGESIMELKTLVRGGEIPLFADNANWQLPLGELAHFGTVPVRTGSVSGADGYDYGSWLGILLYMGSIRTQTMRTMDLIEAAIRRTEGNRAFCMDSCVAGLSVETDWRLKRGIHYTFPVCYAYQ